MSKKILLISISSSWRYSNLGIDQIAGYLLTKEIPTSILYHHRGYNFDDIISKLDFEYEYFGFSVTSANYKCCCEIARYIKTINNKSKIIFGGGYPSLFYNEIYKDFKELDYIILGDGEKPIESILLNSIDDSTNFSIVTPNELLNKHNYCNGKIDYHPVYNYFSTDSKRRNRRKEYLIQTKNNVCTGQCTFCTEKKGKVYFKDIDHLVEEIEYVSGNFSLKKFFITDDNIFDPQTVESKERIKLFCEKIISRNINVIFKCYIKAFSMSDTEEDNNLLSIMYKAGFRNFFIGIESGNQQDLDLYNKKTTINDNETILKLLDRHNIIPQIGFININPYSTLDTLKENFNFLIKSKMNNIFMYVCSYLRVYKYTDIHLKMKLDNLLIDEYDYLDDKSLYLFKDEKVSKIFWFIKENLYDEVRNFDYEFDPLLCFYEECKRINDKVKILEKDFNDMRTIQLSKIKEYFVHIYVHNDLDTAKKLTPVFLDFFKSQQLIMHQLHAKILEYYVEDLM